MLLLLRQQRIQLVDELVEQLQRLVDGSRSGQIHTGQLQQVDGRHGAAAGQELEVVVHSRLAFLQDAAADGDGRGVAGGVLVDVVVVVEVRDARPLQGNLVVHHDVLAKVVLCPC